MENRTADVKETGIKETEEKKDFRYSRNKKYGVLSVSPSGWSKEVCIVSWNDKNPKLDIREWSSDYTKMSKGLTLTKEETKKLLRILGKINLEDFETYKVADAAQATDVVDLGEVDVDLEDIVTTA